MDQDGPVNSIETLGAERGVVDSDATGWMTEFLCEQSILTREDARLREEATAGLTSAEFDQLRKSYQQPAEWTGQRVTIAAGNGELCAAAAQLGLKLASE